MQVGETITQGLVDNTATGHFQKDDLRGFTAYLLLRLP
jgi:hypothetical protein